MMIFSLNKCIGSVILTAAVSLSLSACSQSQSRLPAVHDQSCAAISASTTTLDQQLQPFAERTTTQSGVYVLEQGTESMLTRAWLMEHAQQTLDVQYFIFATDNVGLIATDYLVRAAERGVKVRILVDDIMVDATGGELLTLASHPNIEIKIYNPLANIGKNLLQTLYFLTTDFHAFNQRMHNKALIADGKVVITGGRNVADEYFGYDYSYNFRDRDVLLLGQVTNDVQGSFDLYWQHDLSVPVESLLRSEAEHNAQPDFTALHQYACDPANFLPQIRAQIDQLPEVFAQVQRDGQLHWLDNIEFVADLPGKNDQSSFLSGGSLTTSRLIELLQQAKSSVHIQTPYLVTTELSWDIFRQLVEKGIEVTILTNSLASNDNLEAFSGYQRDREALLETGVKIFEFRPDAQIRQKVMAAETEQRFAQAPIFGLHAKSMVIDDDITVIGTFNLDPRSANLNTESLVIMQSEQVTASVKAGMLEEIKPENAWRVTSDWNPDDEVSEWKQLRVKLRRVVPKGIL